MTSATTVGLLHPGAMGASIGAACGAPVLWCTDGRSAATHRRADASGLTGVATLAELVDRSDLIVSVCPPDRAATVADQVAELDFDGLYVDVNAIAPATSRSIARRFTRYVDGGLIGPPVAGSGTTRLYLAGDEAHTVAALWERSDLDARVIGGSVGTASALKMAYATWTKVSAALLLDVRALARAEGIEDALLAEWDLSQPGAADRSELTAAGVGPKAWRFIGEMAEIERSFGDARLPTGFAVGAAEVYERLTAFKDLDGVALDHVLGALIDTTDAT